MNMASIAILAISRKEIIYGTFPYQGWVVSLDFGLIALGRMPGGLRTYGNGLITFSLITCGAICQWVSPLLLGTVIRASSQCSVPRETKKNILFFYLLRIPACSGVPNPFLASFERSCEQLERLWMRKRERGVARNSKNMWQPNRLHRSLGP